MSEKFDEFPSLPFQDIKENPERHRRMDEQMNVYFLVGRPYRQKRLIFNFDGKNEY